MSAELMIAVEGVTLVFLIVLLVAYLFLCRFRGLKKDWYFYSLSFTLIGVAFDMTAWICETVPAPVFLQYAGNFLSLVMTNCIVTAFGYYTIEQIRKNHSVSRIFARVITVFNLLGVLIAAAGALCGELFEVSSGASGFPVYDDGGLFYEIPIALADISLLLLFGLVLCYGRALGVRKLAVFAVYFLLPLAASILELLNEDLLFIYVAISLSMCIIYIMLQGTHINELVLREQLLNEVSYTDQLTGLLNRRACDRDVARIGENDPVHIVFCDLNGLKRINDEKGHKAGDRFLLTFAKIITRYFPHDAVYRISGDEFVVMDRKMTQEDFDASIAGLRKEINENAGIAALGTISGTGNKIPALIKEAEMGMYADKKKFYRRNPDYRRGKSTYMGTEDSAEQ